jgi:hypothetical protein
MDLRLNGFRPFETCSSKTSRLPTSAQMHVSNTKLSSRTLTWRTTALIPPELDLYFPRVGMDPKARVWGPSALSPEVASYGFSITLVTSSISSGVMIPLETGEIHSSCHKRQWFGPCGKYINRRAPLTTGQRQGSCQLLSQVVWSPATSLWG